MAQEADRVPGMVLSHSMPAHSTAWELSQMHLINLHRNQCLLQPHMPSDAEQICLSRELSVETWVGTWDSRISCILVGIGKQTLSGSSLAFRVKVGPNATRCVHVVSSYTYSPMKDFICSAGCQTYITSVQKRIILSHISSS